MQKRCLTPLFRDLPELVFVVVGFSVIFALKCGFFECLRCGVWKRCLTPLLGKDAKMKREYYYRMAGGASGLMLAAPNIWGVLAPLQAMALLPVLYVAADRGVKRGVVLAAGMYMGLAYTLPQVVYLRMPGVITVILLLYLTAIMMVLNCGWHYLLGRRVVWASLAAGAFLVVVDWVNFTAMPMWGTSQSMVRCWSEWPRCIQFATLTGITGISFVLGSLQAMGVYAIIRPKLRRLLAMVGAVIILGMLGVNAAFRRDGPRRTMVVAAVGWVTGDSADFADVHSEEGFEELFAGPVGVAAARGARLVVSGEVGFYIDKNTYGEWMVRFGDVCRRHNVWLGIGYFNSSADENRLLFMNPAGEVVCEYAKTYLTPFENCHRGDGQLKIVDIDGVRVGGMICQDDNFTCLTRDYGRKAVGVMAVPTLDWSTVKDVHLQTTRHRAIESRQSIVRATINGTSAIISPAGEVLAESDHFEDGAGMICAEVDVVGQRTVFARSGHWPVIFSFVFLAFYIGKNR